MEILTDDDIAIGAWLEDYVRIRDKVCQICHDSSSTSATNPLVVEYKSPDVIGILPKHKNLWLCHWNCHHERQNRMRSEGLRLSPQDIQLPRPQWKKPRYWTGKRVLAVVVLLVDLALCYGCGLFYKWCFRVF